MAEVLISPGVLARENDQSFLQAQPVQAGAAIVGPTVKGPVGIPTLVTTYSDYQNVFGATQQAGVRYTTTTGGRATYNGTKQVYVSLHASIAYEKQGGGTDSYNFYFYKNGSQLPGSQTQIVGGSGASGEGALSLIYGTLMEQNDYIEIYAENPSSNDDILIKDFQLVIRE